MAENNLFDKDHNIIRVRCTDGFKWVDNDTAKYVMGKVVDEAREAIKVAASTMKLSSLRETIFALESKEHLNKLFNVILDRKIPGASTIYSFKDEIGMNSWDGNKNSKDGEYMEAVRVFGEAYVDDFDKNDELATLLLKSMSEGLSKKKVE